MDKNQLLLDNFSAEGQELTPLKENIKAMTEATGEIIAHGKDITFLSLCELKEMQVDGKLTFFVLSPEYLDDFLKEGQRLRAGTVPIDQLGQELADELVKTSGLLVVIDDERYILSEKAIKTLTRQTCLGGDEMIAEHCFARNLYLATCVFRRNDKLKIVYREENGIKKIFGFFKHKYARYPQTVLTDAVKKLKATVSKWAVSQDVTDIFTNWGEKGKNYTPGIFFRTSDIGRGSLIARSIITFDNGGHIILQEIPFMHCNKYLNIDMAEEVEDTFKKDISAFSKEYGAKADLEIIDYSRIDPEKEENAAINRQMVEETVEKLAREVFRKVKIPKGRFEAAFASVDKLKELKEQVKQSNKNAKKKAEWKTAKSVYHYVQIENRKYTYGDIIAIIAKAIDVLEENGLDESTVTEMRSCDFLNLKATSA